jgi:hypothetical protein
MKLKTISVELIKSRAMIDFIKIHYKDKSDFEPFVLKEGNFENVYGQVDAHTGEMGYPYKTSYETMNYVVSQKTGCIKNSLHKFYNNAVFGQDQNFNDFTYSNLKHSINHLKRKMIKVDDTSITHLEFGLNISVQIPAEEIIRKNILMHNLKGFNHNKQYYGQGELKQFDHNNYFIKIYDKAKQYRKEFKLTQNILRLELKINKSREFHEVGVFNLNDLLDKGNLQNLFILFLKRFDELTIIDDIKNFNQFKEEDKYRLKEYLNPRFWEGLKEQKKYQTRSRKRREFERIQSQYNLNQTKQELRVLIIENFNYLINN